MKHAPTHGFDSRGHAGARAPVWFVIVALCAGAAAGPRRAEAAAATQPAAAKATPAAMHKETVRTLDAVHIEGEVAVPQVLFITSRDARRFRDGLGSKYQRSASDIAGLLSPPQRLRVVAKHELNQEEGK